MPTANLLLRSGSVAPAAMFHFYSSWLRLKQLTLKPKLRGAFSVHTQWPQSPHTQSRVSEYGIRKLATVFARYPLHELKMNRCSWNIWACPDLLVERQWWLQKVKRKMFSCLKKLIFMLCRFSVYICPYFAFLIWDFRLNCSAIKAVPRPDAITFHIVSKGNHSILKHSLLTALGILIKVSMPAPIHLSISRLQPRWII